MKKIVLTEDQLNRLVEMKHKNVFKDEHKMKDAVESHLSEEKEVCGCGCEIGKCECGPECAKCDCGKEKEAKEDWDPTGSVGVSGVAQDVARKGMNTLWEQEQMGLIGLHQEPFFGGHGGKEWVGASGVNYHQIDFQTEVPGDFETIEVESLEQAKEVLGLSDREFNNLIHNKWYGSTGFYDSLKNKIGNLILKIRSNKESKEDWDTPKYEIPGMKDSMNDLDDLVNSVKRKEVNESILNNFKRFL